MNVGAIILFSAALLTLVTNTQKVAARGQDRTTRTGAPRGPGGFFGINLGQGDVVRTFDVIYNQAGAVNNINPRLLKAVALTESGESPQAVNPNDPSYGMMQVLCVPDGRGGCSNRLNVRGWPPESQEQLFDPSYNVGIAAQILDWNISQYGYPKGIAVYNAWSARHDPQDGPFRNQGYVNKVLTFFEENGGGHYRDTRPIE